VAPKPEVLSFLDVLESRKPRKAPESREGTQNPRTNIEYIYIYIYICRYDIIYRETDRVLPYSPKINTDIYTYIYGEGQVCRLVDR